MVPQNRSLFNELTVEDNLRFACWTFRNDKPRVAQAIERAYERFPMLRDRRRHLAGAMSGGQQRFLELGRALVLDPRVLLLDEPTAMVAPKLARRSTSSSPHCRSRAFPCCWSTRTCASARASPNHIYVLELGRNKVDGSASDFTQDSALRSLIAEWVDYRIDA